MTSTLHDTLAPKIDAGERLTAAEISALAATDDILTLGMLADAVRRRLRGVQVTYVRVASFPHDKPIVDAVPPAARELRLTGTPASLDAALAAVAAAREAARDIVISGFSWPDLEAVAAAAGVGPSSALERLRAAGLDAVAEIPADRVADLPAALDALGTAGFRQLRITIERAPAAERVSMLLQVAELQDRHPLIQAINPLPTVINPFRPTTGYEDVRTVALARIAAPHVPSVQVDWLRYGPKLAQVALTFGADDIDGVSASDESPDGRRRAPLEELRRNVEAAGFTAAERDGRFVLIA